MMSASNAQILDQDGIERNSVQQGLDAALVPVRLQKQTVGFRQVMQIFGRQAARDKQATCGNPLECGRTHFLTIGMQENVHGGCTHGTLLRVLRHDSTLFITGVQKFLVHRFVALFVKRLVMDGQEVINIGQSGTRHDAFDRNPNMRVRIVKLLGQVLDHVPFQGIAGGIFDMTAFTGKTGIRGGIRVLLRMGRQVTLAQSGTGPDTDFGTRAGFKLIQGWSIQVMDFRRLQGQTAIALCDKIINDPTLDQTLQVHGTRIVLQIGTRNEQIAQIGQAHFLIGRHKAGTGNASDNHGRLGRGWGQLVVSPTLLEKGCHNAIAKGRFFLQDRFWLILRRIPKGVGANQFRSSAGCASASVIQYAIQTHAAVGPTNVPRQQIHRLLLLGRGSHGDADG